MKHRTGTAVAALALVLAACQAGSSTPETDSTTTTTAAPATTTTTAVSTTTTTVAPSAEGPSTPSGSVAAPEATLLSYRFEPNSVMTYAVDLHQHVVMHADGDDPQALGEDELPLDADVSFSAASLMTYEVFPGPSDGTYEIEITVSFDDVAAEGTVNGETIDSLSQDGLVSELGTIEPIATTVIVDEQGNVVSSDGDQVDLFGGGMAALGGLATDELGRPMGPEFPADEELTVGDTWSDTVTQPGPDGEDFSATVTHTVTDAQKIGSATTLVIESVTKTDAIDIDFSDFFKALFQGFAGLGGEEGEVPPEVQEMLDQLVFSISIAPTTATANTWFDPESGLVRRVESNSSISLGMQFKAPDETTGEIVGFEMQMDLDQAVTLGLVEDGA